MQQERIIEGIEKVFEGYAKDKELREAIKGSHQYLLLFGQGSDGFVDEFSRLVHFPGRCRVARVSLREDPPF